MGVGEGRLKKGKNRREERKKSRHKKRTWKKRLEKEEKTKWCSALPMGRDLLKMMVREPSGWDCPRGDSEK